jgi:hypothetical protein
MIFILDATPRPTLIFSALGNVDPPSDVKRLLREGEYSLPSSAKAKDMWSYISAPPYVFMAWFLCAEILPLPLHQTDWRTENLRDLFSQDS